jgi:hypothetical protein
LWDSIFFLLEKKEKRNKMIFIINRIPINKDVLNPNSCPFSKIYGSFSGPKENFTSN